MLVVARFVSRSVIDKRRAITRNRGSLNLCLIWLLDSSDNSRVKIRYDITKNILNEKSIKQHVIRMKENIFESRFLNIINYGDWLSYWCAIVHNTDPSPVSNIDRLKIELSKI